MIVNVELQFLIRTDGLACCVAIIPAMITGGEEEAVFVRVPLNLVDANTKLSFLPRLTHPETIIPAVNVTLIVDTSISSTEPPYVSIINPAA